MKFYICVKEVRSTAVEVEAENEQEAMKKAEEAYRTGDICLDDPECTEDVALYDHTSRWQKFIASGIPYNFQKVN